MFAQILKALWSPAVIKGSETLAKESAVALGYVVKAAKTGSGFSDTTKSIAGYILSHPEATKEAKHLAAAILGTLSKR